MLSKILTLAAAVLLSGCDITSTPDQLTDAYRDYLPESASGRRSCTQFVKWPDQVVEVDSTSFCPYSDSGFYYPVLVRATWTATNSTCSLIGDHGNTGESAVVGGIKGIKRFHGCYKKPIAYPVVPPILCVDCNDSAASKPTTQENKETP
jgi:hypothetical protein